MGPGPNDRRPVGVPHPPGLRGEPAAAADRPHRPVPDAPRRPDNAVGGDLAGDGAARPRRQGHLRRQQQLRRLAHRHRPARRRVAALPRAGLRAEPVQPDRPHDRARGHPRLRTYGLGLIPWARSAAGCSPARSAGHRRARRRSTTRQQHDRGDTASGSRPTRRSVRELGEQPADVALAWLLHNPVVTAPIIGARTARAADQQPPRRPESRWHQRRCSGSTTSGRGRAAKRPRSTPGDPTARQCCIEQTLHQHPHLRRGRHRGRAVPGSVEQRGQPGRGPARRLTLRGQGRTDVPRHRRDGAGRAADAAPTTRSAGPTPRSPSGTCGSTTSTSPARSTTSASWSPGTTGCRSWRWRPAPASR